MTDPTQHPDRPAGQSRNQVQKVKDAVAILLSRVTPRPPETRRTSRWIASDEEASAPDSLY